MNFIPDKTAKAYAREEIVIESSPAKVYSILSDINNWPLWQSQVMSAKIEGVPEEGKEFIWKSGNFHIHSRLHTVNPEHELGWTGRMVWFTAIHNWTITGQGNRSLVTVEESLKGFLAGTMKNPLKKGMKQSLEELKTTCENKSS